MLAPDDIYFKEIPKSIIPEDNRSNRSNRSNNSNNITPLVLIVINFAIFVTLGLLMCGYFYFK